MVTTLTILCVGVFDSSTGALDGSERRCVRMAGEQRVDEALGRVRAFVSEALALRLRGRSDNYNLIISQLR